MIVKTEVANTLMVDFQILLLPYFASGMLNYCIVQISLSGVLNPVL